jgi:Domain of unknown function (DUF5667)
MKESKKTSIEILLESKHPSLSQEKKDAVWSAILSEIEKKPIRSPYIFSFRKHTTMTPLALALILMLGVGGTTFASNDARPGDLLFPVDQALEDARLALARNDDDRARLHIAFAEERLEELRSILGESTTSPSDTIATSSITRFEAEADVFTDTTLVKVEMNDRTTTFETRADTRDEVIDEIVSRYGVSRSTVESVLDFEIEDRASRIDDNDNTRDSDSSDDDSDTRSSSSDDSTDSPDDSDGRVRIEVKVEDGVAEVKLETGDTRDEFETAYTSETALVRDLAERSGLSEDLIRDNLALEIKD